MRFKLTSTSEHVCCFLISTIFFILISCGGGGGGGGEEQNISPNGVIDSPSGNMAILVGESITFSGTGSDPDGDLPLEYKWNFGGAGIPGSKLEDPGSEQFDIPGVFAVTFTVTDAEGLSDPSPFTRTISVIYDYYVALGDSITLGEGDYQGSGADGTCPFDGLGYEPILEDLLTDYYNIGHTIVNAGKSGEESSGGLARINTVISANSGANYFLIQYGTNDSAGSMPVPSGLGTNPPTIGTYKYNMQQIINAIVAAGMEPRLAKVPIALGPCGDPSVCGRYADPDSEPRNGLIKAYNQVVDELVSENGISVTPPDFYNYFLENQTEIYSLDNYHPNCFGYQSMANLWLTAITGQ